MGLESVHVIRFDVSLEWLARRLASRDAPDNFSST